MNIQYPQLSAGILKSIPRSFTKSYRAWQYRKNFDDKYFVHSTRAHISSVENIEKVPYPEVMSEQSKTQTSPSDNAIIEINSTCNIDCLMCKTSLSTRKKGLIKEQTLEQAIQRLKEHGIKNVSLHTIGDPLANPRLRAVLSKFRQYQLKVSLTSNGLLLKRHVTTLLEYWDICSAIRFSIDGASKDVYEKIRSGGNWEELIENLEIAKNKLLYRSNYTIIIGMVVSKDNVFEVGEYIELFRNYVDHPSVNLHFGLVNSLSPDNSYFNQVNLFKNHTYPVIPCGYTFNQVPFVLFDGRYSICCRDYDGSLVIGDITSDSVKEAFGSQAMQQVKIAHAQGDVSLYPLCQTCYAIDDRVMKAFSFLMKTLIHKCPKADASFYQEKVNRFVKVFQEGNDLKTRYDNLLRSF